MKQKAEARLGARAGIRVGLAQTAKFALVKASEVESRRKFWQYGDIVPNKTKSKDNKKQNFLTFQTDSQNYQLSS